VKPQELYKRVQKKKAEDSKTWVEKRQTELCLCFLGGLGPVGRICAFNRLQQGVWGGELGEALGLPYSMVKVGSGVGQFPAIGYWSSKSWEGGKVGKLLGGVGGVPETAIRLSCKGRKKIFVLLFASGKTIARGEGGRP